MHEYACGQHALFGMSEHAWGITSAWRRCNVIIAQLRHWQRLLVGRWHASLARCRRLICAHIADSASTLKKSLNRWRWLRTADSVSGWRGRPGRCRRSLELADHAVLPLHGVPYYLVTELEWDTMDELRAAFASPEGQATAADAARLQELAPVRRMIFTVDDCVM
jgi:hypothetical protein